MRPRGRDIYQLTQMVGKYLHNGTGANSVVAQVQEALARRTDETVRIERQRRRLERKRLWASRWATAWALISLIAVTWVVLSFAGLVDNDSDLENVIGGIAVALVTGALAIRSTRRMVLLKRAQREFDGQHKPQQVTPALPVMPPKGSAAREPMQRLAEAEVALSELMRQLAGAEGMPASVPLESVAQAEQTGVEAANALRAVAAQLVAVELARDHAPSMERGPLVDGVRRLREQLDEGLDGYRSLVAAAGRVVAASSSAGPKQDLADATDHLAGLAVALRELSDRL